MATNSVAVRIAGKEYRIRSDAEEAWLQRVARYVDDSLRKIRERTRSVDSLDVAILAALNLARELIELREADDKDDSSDVPLKREQMVELIEFVESELSLSEAPPRLDA